MLASGSVVIMPPPTQEGWAGLLRPWFHYVPLGHPSDIDRVMTWLAANDAAARRIVRNANSFVHRLVSHNRQRCRSSAPFSKMEGSTAINGNGPEATTPDSARVPARPPSVQAGLGVWRWSRARDGSVEEVSKPKRFLDLLSPHASPDEALTSPTPNHGTGERALLDPQVQLLRPQVANALIQHAAAAWEAFHRASASAPEHLAFWQ